MTAGMVILRKLLFDHVSVETLFEAFAIALILELLMRPSSKRHERK